jgi:potassium-transporting ATPase KdpC subunit
MIRSQLKPALILFGLLAILTGMAYPLLITGVAQLVFPYQANGSLIVQNGQVKGSALIGQQFDKPKYFWGRPSATSPYPYNASGSSGSNLGPTNPALIHIIQARVQALKQADPSNQQAIPIDLITASGSGLDPDISPAAAYYQVMRVARVRGIPEDNLRQLVSQHIQGRELSFLGEPRVNVLALNLALDALQ